MFVRSHESRMMEIDDCDLAAEEENEMSELDVKEREEICMSVRVREPDLISQSDLAFVGDANSNLRRENVEETVMTKEISYVRMRTVLEVVPWIVYEEKLWDAPLSSLTLSSKVTSCCCWIVYLVIILMVTVAVL